MSDAALIDDLRELINAASFPPILTVEQAARMTGLSIDWLNQGRCKGFGPPYLRLARKAIRYDRDALLAWCRAHEVRP
jgi:hypothetical protein